MKKEWWSVGYEVGSVEKMLATAGYRLYQSSLCCATPFLNEQWKRMGNSVPGDVVIEVSTGGWFSRPKTPSSQYLDASTHVGILDRITEEPYPSEEPWDEAVEGRSEPKERVFYIKSISDGEEFRWVNASFITIIPVEGWA